MGCVIETTAPASGEMDRQPAERVHPVARVLPSLTDLAFLLPVIFLFGGMNGSHSMLGDGDTGWHIRTGQWILAHGRVPQQDIFSYTMPGQPWFAWEWLWDVAFAKIFQYAGMAGVVLASILVVSFTMALLFRLVRRKCGNVLIAFAVTALAIAGSSMHWLARPHLFTLLFGVIFYSILERAKDAQEAGDGTRARRWLMTLPVLTILWTNLHGGWFVGVILLACYAAGELARWLVATSRGERAAALAGVGRYGVTACAALAASLVNPYFYHLHQHLFAYLTTSYQYEHIAEFQSISFHYSKAWLMEAMMVLAAVAAFRELGRKQFAYVFLMAGWMHLALVSGRNIPIFMLIAAPLVAANLGELAGRLAQAPVARWLRSAAARFQTVADDLDETDRIGRVHLVSLAAMVAIAAVFYAPAPPEKFQASYDPKHYPAQAIQFLGGAGITNRIFTHDEWGDYLIYRLYPTKVFVDGRSDFYGDKFCEKYIDVMNVKYDWQQNLDRYAVDTVLLPPDAPLASAMKESRNWRVVYDDHVAVVFRAAAGRSARGEQASAVQVSSGTGRDRKITKLEQRDRPIT